MTRHQKKWILALLLAALVVWALWANKALEVNTYTLSSSRIPESFDGFRIVQISDFHNEQFGEGNEKLLDLVAETSPDIIVITGDMIDSRRTNVEIALDLAEELVKIAPVYYVTGNHEVRVKPEYETLQAGLAELGVTQLKNESVWLTRGEERVLLMGLEDPTFRWSRDPKSTVGLLQDMKPETGEYTIVLSHRPELFEQYVESGVDLVLTGHAHGGQIRIPLIGGVLVPDQGLFPEYDAGLFTQGDTTMIISRGVGSSVFPLRINNRPEIVVAELRTK